MIILDRHQIEDLIDLPAAAAAIRDVFCSTSRGEVNLPPVGHITFPQVSGDRHITIADLTGIAAHDIAIADIVLKAHRAKGGQDV
ncbi:hypothetical protein [Ascidiaceihabitans sp.]|uniref:hypothetical protein n=1 Tax=Ascidiaceihabitans sp. TaxID=1872644 RepID=UPI00329739E6